MLFINKLQVSQLRMQNSNSQFSPTQEVLQNSQHIKITSTVDKYSFDGLSKHHIQAYAVGHTLNDLVATCWFNYLIYFLKKVLFVDSVTDAILIGQVVDGIATPLIGYWSDKFNTRIGQRKPWYIAGVILVAFSTVMLFCGYKSSNSVVQASFYITMALIFCLGFATLQISHMSLVPALTCSRKRRDQLNNLRNLFTFVSNFVVLGFGLIIFSFMTDKILEYRILGYVSTSIGVVASLYFILIIDEPKLTRICKQKQIQLKKILQQQKNNNNELTQSKELQSNQLGITLEQQHNKSPSDNHTVQSESLFMWFKQPKFYLYGICYVSARLYVNMFGTLIPFYINDVLKMVDSNQDKISFNLALIPMLVYIASVLMSCKLNYFYRVIGRKNSLLLGTFICMTCSFSMVFIDEYNRQYFYAIAMLIGASQSLVLSTGVNLISDVVGAKAKSGAFVFGVYSMIDKIAVGVAIFVVVETEAYSKTTSLTAQDRDFIKWTVILVPGISCLLSAFILSLTSVNEYAKVDEQSDQSSKKSVLEGELVY